MQNLNEISNRLIQSINIEFKRHLYSEIDWQQTLVEIKGARGVGKTTLMLQKALELSRMGQEVLYISADLPYFYKNSLFETAENFYKYGGKYLFIDEVHKYPKKQKHSDWSLEIKNIYDSIPDLHVVYSGSSILQLHIGQGDLSRRKNSYLLNGLSFREFIFFIQQLQFNSFTLQDILSSHVEISNQVIGKIKILPLF